MLCSQIFEVNGLRSQKCDPADAGPARRLGPTAEAWPAPPVTAHIGGVSPGTEEGARMMQTPSPAIASASGTSRAALGGRSFWARARMAVTDIQVTLMTPSASSMAI